MRLIAVVTVVSGKIRSQIVLANVRSRVQTVCTLADGSVRMGDEVTPDRPLSRRLGVLDSASGLSHVDAERAYVPVGEVTVPGSDDCEHRLGFACQAEVEHVVVLWGCAMRSRPGFLLEVRVGLRESVTWLVAS